MNDSSVSAASLRNLGARLNTAIDAVIQAESDLNAIRRKASMEPVKAFYLPSEHRIGVREAEARKPQEGWPSRQQQPRQRSPYDPMTCLRVIVAAMAHPELCSEDWPTIVELMADLAARGQDEPTDEQAKTIAEFCDGFAQRMRAVGPKSRARRLRKHREWWAETQVEEDEDDTGREDDEPDNKDDEIEDGKNESGPPPVKVPPDSRDKDKLEAVHVATAAEILRAGAVRRGEVTALPVDPVAREIIRQGALRRGEKDPTL
ncbi:MAG TPA: hypothetical protein VFE60_11910 [Roseiarcus sp.]|jgi:hypothetical protein|nr:hypothetical protein [Roseiarcus sp.]